MKNSLLKNSYPHLIAVFFFLLIALIYYYPILSGKKLVQNDVIQTQGALKESGDYQKKTGEEILWSNSSFGGMPVWRGYTSNVLLHIHRGITSIIPTTVYLTFLAFLGFYVLMLVFTKNPWLCFIFSSAFAFSSFNIISIEAGHVNKVLSMATMAPVIGGILLVYRKKYLLGAAITALFLSLHILFAHFQITYYLIIIIVFLGVYELINAFLTKELKHFFIASGILITSAVIAVGPNTSQLWTTQVYSASTTRGGSELTSKKTDAGGLDFDYAMTWSNGVDELMTILIPYYYGGSSNEALSQNSETYKALIDNNVPVAESKKFIKNIPLYWGDQPFTSGPVYFGAIIVFLFILGMFLIKDRYKWWILSVCLVAMIVSMGKNAEWLSKLLFYNLPLYNKFRSVTMAISIAQVLFPFLAGAAVIKIVSEKIDKQVFMKSLIWAGSISGLLLLLGFVASMTASFVAEGDAQLTQLPEWVMESIRADRAAKLRGDIFKSLILIALTAGLLWAYVFEKIKPVLFFSVLAFLIVVDLLVVDKRYLNAENFKNEKSIEREIYGITSADELILEDNDYFRVLNVAKNPFNDATTSFYHKSIGGYSAIKLGKYQDLIENQLSKNNMGVLNMLNTRYFIVPDQRTQEGQLQKNPYAMGNAWFVPQYKIVANADEEMSSLDSINPSAIAYIDKRFEAQVTGFSPSFDSIAQIKLIEYHPNRLTYSSKTSIEQLAVFSEIYYQPGWNAYIDGKLSPHIRANYLLRALRVPAGEHTILFKFEPAHYFIGEKVSLAGSILLFLFAFTCLFIEYRKNINRKS